MSVIRNYSDVTATSVGVNEHTQCFLCGEPLQRPPTIVWVGNTGSIAFHAVCGTSFVLRLARDCWELERDASDLRPPALGLLSQP
jgi:hypothetical protein